MTNNFQNPPGQETEETAILAQATLQQALLHHQQGQLAQAQVLYENLLKIAPQHFDGLHLFGCLAFQTNRHRLAIELISKAIAINPNVAALHFNIGAVFQALQQLDKALISYDKAIALKPDYADAHNNRGNVLKDLNRLDEALISYDNAIAFRPNYAEAYNNRGNALQGLKRFSEALDNYDKTLALKPNFAGAYYNRGDVLRILKRADEALLSYDKAIALKPDYAAAHNSRGNVLKDLKRPAEALASYDKAIAFKLNIAELYYNRGAALNDLKRLDEALASYGKAIALKPDYADAYNNRGNVLQDLRRLDDALINYEKAFALKPDCEFLLGTLLLTKLSICDWRGLNESLVNYEASIRAAKKVTRAFPALSLLDSPEVHLQAAKIWAATLFPKKGSLGAFKQQAMKEKIRIGYYSADFREHPITYLMAELFETHNKDKFEIYAFSFGPRTNDKMFQRVSSAFDKFIDAGKMSDSEVAVLSRELGIDIAVDLGGYTQFSRTGVFAFGCAPIQVNYLGYPGTMGADYIDYVIADKTIIPVEHQACFSEKIVYMPHSFQVNDTKRKISDKVFTKAELDLPEAGFVFCCFNNNYKILPSVFDSWMKILAAVKDSVLWLYAGNQTAINNLRKEAKSRGVNSDRLIFAKSMAYEDYLARYQYADLFLDTLPYNAGTTASDALWAGLPVITCEGKSFAGRMAASLLNALELPELIARTQEEYEVKAIELAANPEKLSAIKRKLQQHRLTTPLFDATLFARDIESAYDAMYRRYQAGLAPENIVVSGHGH